MDIQYYVLGKKDNEMLFEYLQKYLVLLKQRLNLLSKKGILTEKIDTFLSMEDIKDFILNPDISSIIELLNYEIILGVPQYLGDVQIYINKLEKEIDFFMSGNVAQLTMNQGKKIPGTEIRLTDIDINPYNQVDAHPEHKKDGGMVSWGSATEENWLEVYAKTFEILKKINIGTYDELSMMIKKIVPLGTSKGIHNSCSYKECVGHLYMGYTIDAGTPEINNLEALIHESSHNKLNLLMHFDPILQNDYQEIYYSPYRPDPRHMHGTYLGLHAFAPTIYIILGAYLGGIIKDSYWGEKIMLYHIKNKLALKVIEKYAILTPLGIVILEEMKYILKMTDEMIKTLNLGKDELLNVNIKAKSHYTNVVERYHNVLR